MDSSNLDLITAGLAIAIFAGAMLMMLTTVFTSKK